MEHAAHPSLAAQEDGGPDRLQRNVIAALRRALAEHPEGCLEAKLWHGVEACGVARRVFDEAIVSGMADCFPGQRRWGSRGS